MLRICGAEVYTQAFNFQKLDLLIDHGKIKALIPNKHPIAEDDDLIDAKGLKLIPGMIDIHIHGAMGYDTMEANKDSLDAISNYLARVGVTSFLPTTMTTPVEELEAVFRLTPELLGARMLGFNMEGPFINVEKRGAHRAEDVRNASIEEFRRYLDLAKVKVVTLAPETEGAMEFIETFQNDTVISLGHTSADYETAAEAIGRGAKSITHTFNAMPPLLHRDPGVIGAATRFGIFGEIICDGVHVHPAVIYCAYRLLGKDRLILVSDSMRAAGLGDGSYELGGQMMEVKDSVARTADGALAGSTSNIWAGMKHAVEFGIPLEDAVRMVTYNPAVLIGEEHRKGQIKAGMDADFLLLDDDLQIMSVYIDGQKLDFDAVQ